MSIRATGAKLGGAGEIRTHVSSIKSRVQLPLCDDPVVYPICLRIFALQFPFNLGAFGQGRTDISFVKSEV